MADTGRHDRRNARFGFATGTLGSRTRDIRQRSLPTEHGPAALSSEWGTTCEYQIDSSSKRPTWSATLEPRKGTLSFLRPKPLRRLSGVAKEGKLTMVLKWTDT
jgi:hypothetical protein